jgi:hypothetical protein
MGEENRKRELQLTLLIFHTLALPIYPHSLIYSCGPSHFLHYQLVTTNLVPWIASCIICFANHLRISFLLYWYHKLNLLRKTFLLIGGVSGINLYSYTRRLIDLKVDHSLGQNFQCKSILLSFLTCKLRLWYTLEKSFAVIFSFSNTSNN